MDQIWILEGHQHLPGARGMTYHLLLLVVYDYLLLNQDKRLSGTITDLI